MKKFSRRTFLGASATTVAITANQLITGCTKKGEVNLYSSRHYNTDNELYAGFTRATGIKVNLVEGSAEELIARIKSEGRNSPADILVTVDAGKIWLAEEAGLFAPVSSKVLEEKIPANLRHPQGQWFGFSKRARVIMYNKERVDRSQLSTYENLADPKWRGKIAVRSSSNLYNQSLVAALIEIHGAKAAEEWCRGLVANFARPPQGNDMDQIEAAASGIADLAIANTYYLPRFAKDPNPAKQEVFKKVAVFFPNQQDRGTHFNISGGGILKTAPNREGAIKFLEYLTSSTAQKFFALGNDEYPVVEGIPLDPIVAVFGEFKADKVNVSSYGRNNAMAVRIMDRAGWK